MGIGGGGVLMESESMCSKLLKLLLLIIILRGFPKRNETETMSEAGGEWGNNPDGLRSRGR